MKARFIVFCTAIAFPVVISGCTYMYNNKIPDECCCEYSKVILPGENWYFRECYKETVNQFVSMNFQRGLMICKMAYGFYRHADIKLLHDVTSRIANDRWIVDSYARLGLRECDRGKIYRQLAEKAFFYYFEGKKAK